MTKTQKAVLRKIAAMVREERKGVKEYRALSSKIAKAFPHAPGLKLIKDEIRYIINDENAHAVELQHIYADLKIAIEGR